MNDPIARESAPDQLAIHRDRNHRRQTVDAMFCSHRRQTVDAIVKVFHRLAAVATKTTSARDDLLGNIGWLQAIGNGIVIPIKWQSIIQIVLSIAIIVTPRLQP